MRPQSLQGSIFRTLFRVGESLDIPRARLLEAADETEERLAVQDTRVSYEALRRVWELLVSVGNDQPLGVRLAECLEPTHFGLVGYVLVNSPDLRTAMVRHCRVYTLLDPRTAWHTTDTPSGMRVELRLHPEDAWAIALRHPAEGLMLALIATGRALTGTRWSPRRVRFAHPRHAASSAVDDFLGITADYDAGAYAMEADEPIPSLPIRHADIDLGNLLHARAEAALADAHAAERRAWKERVREVLAAQPRTGELGPAEVASRLAVSERTLQRRLREEGASFAGLEDEVRRERAFQLLRDGQLAHFEIAFLLGFSDPSAFTRAFRRWSGTTPLAWQKEHAPGTMS
ncbi:helix-turn-helix domain-containing protein [Pyxidicoccus fallax]|uniref:AraC family transcriptional regulator n=1 Tax=Pyxidicoccus fallax TaxID=394095 RepID=A0A848L664_9BACT|nr:AraC family transcriptional regulator [Pyxidicoccus fallax]NMO14164.1 AraC family transcriptional regulator [Pyxidicoccus fallax]NPC81491.1 helix-turn-helix domain-containing protein [Pyxidicoccus fallax]